MTTAAPPEKMTLDALRAEGWAVAVHNDYRMNGEAHTFWLFTKGDHCVKGEGRTDAEALIICREAARRLSAPAAGHKPDCGADGELVNCTCLPAAPRVGDDVREAVRAKVKNLLMLEGPSTDGDGWEKFSGELTDAILALSAPPAPSADYGSDK